MMKHLRCIFALLGKDLHCLAPLVVLAIGMFVTETLLSNLDLNISNPFFLSVVTALPQINTLVIGLVAIAVIQQDPANSQDHDSLTRPISRMDLCAEKLLFLLLTITLPIFLSRLVFNLFSEYSLIAATVEASIARTPWTFIATLVFIGISILSRSLIQSVVLLVGALLLFGLFGVIMDSFPRNPEALQDDFTTQAVIWIIAAPMYLIFALVLSLIFWLQYKRRNVLLAYSAFAGGFVVTLLVVLLPFVLPSWPAFFSLLQKSVANPESALAEDLRLDSLYGCFPSSVIDLESGVSSYGPLQQVIASQVWDEEELIASGTGSVAFSTTVAARNFPKDWRVALLKVTAVYESNSSSERIKVRPARRVVQNQDAQYENLINNYWLLSSDTVANLREMTGKTLNLDYSLALLAPNSKRLEVDGSRHYLEGIGYCRAEREQFNNRIHVECFQRGPRPTYLSARLLEIESSEVDAGAPSYAPDLVQLSNGRRYETYITAASLSNESSVLLTGYEPRGIFHKSLSFDGVLGDSDAQCLLPSLNDPVSLVQSSWSDSSPHEVMFVSVEDEVRLEVLDWGGSGRPIVLIPGLGASAHAFDDLAPLLSENYRVIGITRRGIGASSKPEYGYEIERLSEDILSVLTTLEISDPVLVGHSLGGDELSMIGSRHPNLVSGLIYLDAAYDRSESRTDIDNLNRKLPAQPRPDMKEMTNYEAFKGYLSRIGNLGPNPIPEGEVISGLNLDNGSRRLDPRIPDAIMAGLIAPDYENITAPALGIFAVPSAPDLLMKKWYDQEDQEVRKTISELFQLRNTYQREEIEKFRSGIASSQAIELIDADHGVFFSHQAEVLSAMRVFIESLDSQ